MNLYLKVVGKRADGYHLVDTVMAPVSLYDEVEIRKPGRGREAISVTCDHPAVPSGKRNLAYKAASLLLEKKGLSGPVAIHIRKRIPVGAGLGGGSSDAAATLTGLNRLFRLRLKRAELLSLAASVGADVPFFVLGRPSRARGVGERLTPLTRAPRLRLVVVYPGISVPTGWVYRKFPSKLTKKIENTSMTFSWRGPKQLADFLVNDLERVAIRRYPRIGQLKQRLIEEGAAGALMSGSGSSVFGIFLTGQGARNACRRLQKEKSVEAFVVHTLTGANNRSANPLDRAADRVRRRSPWKSPRYVSTPSTKKNSGLT